MKIRRVHHVGIAVRNLEESLSRWKALFGVKASSIEELPERGVKVAHLEFNEGPVLEFVAALGEASPLTRFLEGRGEGIHHLTLEVEDLESVLGYLKKKGLELIDQGPRRGAGESRIAFVHPKSLNGVLLELRERKKEKSE